MNKVFCMILFAVLAGCSSELPTIGEATELGQVCDSGNDGKRVSVEGFLTLPQEMPVDESIALLLEIRRSEDVEKMNGRVGVWTQYSSEPNRVACVDVDTPFPVWSALGVMNRVSRMQSNYLLLRLIPMQICM